MRAMHPLRIGLVLAWSLSAATARAEVPPDLEARARGIVEEERAAAGTPAMSVAVFADGRVVALFASGEADLEAHAAATNETLYPAASVTKILTAALVMREVERGKLSLDAPVNESLPAERQVRDASGAPVPVTLRQLLSHSSGVPVSWAGIQSDPNEPPRSLDDLLAPGLRTIRPPGEKLIYANDAFALAGWMAARAGGVPFDALAREGLFEPLRMTSSTLVPPRDAGPRLAAAYGGQRLLREGARSTPDGVRNHAAARWITTPADLALRARHAAGRKLDGARVLSQDSVAEMMRMQARAHPRLPAAFGLGFGVREEPGRKLVWWDGGLAGSASRLALLPEHGVGVAILSNLSDNAPVIAAADRILALLVPPGPRAANAASGAPSDALAGTYRFEDVSTLDEPPRMARKPARVEGARPARLHAVRDRRRGAGPAGDSSYVLTGRSIFAGARVLLDGDPLPSARRGAFRPGRASVLLAGCALAALAARRGRERGRGSGGAPAVTRAG
jgi:CubicO group peptidase (beta-lactamase class C family)